MIPNWEYKVEHLDEDELDQLELKLNQLGLEGWELVSWDSETGIFKRLLPVVNTLYQVRTPFFRRGRVYIVYYGFLGLYEFAALPLLGSFNEHLSHVGHELPRWDNKANAPISLQDHYTIHFFVNMTGDVKRRSQDIHLGL